ncbi:MAG: phage holin family protein [Paenibacillaceae bacterium]
MRRIRCDKLIVIGSLRVLELMSVDRWDLIVKWTAAVCGSITSYLFGGWSALLNILLFFVVIDYITGIIAAGVRGELRSTVGLIGITKKIFIFIMVAIAYKIDIILGDVHFLEDTVIFFYLANELLSIIENGGRLGVTIPPVIRKAVEILQGKSEDDKDEGK